MAKKFADLLDRMSPEAQEEVARDVRRMIAEMPLHRLRSARELTQENLAQVLGLKQGDISKMERRADMYVSTLASYVKAMGGTLEIRAVFPDGGIVKINQFEALGKTPQ
jgi:ribosome-binding protein aMBF1 (putative translation factor)